MSQSTESKRLEEKLTSLRMTYEDLLLIRQQIKDGLSTTESLRDALKNIISNLPQLTTEGMPLKLIGIFSIISSRYNHTHLDDEDLEEAAAWVEQKLIDLDRSESSPTSR